MISLLDYGVGNLASVLNAFAYLGVPASVVDAPAQVRGADRLVVPGVGAFRHGMETLRSRGFADEIRELALVRQRPVLGICLGMQLLLGSSSEGGETAGLGLLAGTVRALAPDAPGLVVPHVGWNDLLIAPHSRLLDPVHSGCAMYFVHGYYCRLEDRSIVTGTTPYGVDMDVMVESGNVFGCQFHPEKSQHRGLDILKNFAAA